MRRSLRKAWATRAPLSLQDVSFRFRRRGCGCRAVVVVDGGDSGWVDGDWLDVVQVDVDWVDGGWVNSGWVVCPRVA